MDWFSALILPLVRKSAAPSAACAVHAAAGGWRFAYPPILKISIRSLAFLAVLLAASAAAAQNQSDSGTPSLDSLQQQLDQAEAAKAAAAKAAREAAAQQAARQAAAERAAQQQTAAAAAAKAQAAAALAAIESKMITIPAGSFVMGSPDSEDGRGSDEGPQHNVNVASFALAKYDVTFAEWDACVADGGCNGYRPGDQGWGRGNRPVINVSWDDAQAYIQWISRKTGHQYRLPTEAEWEYTARAGTTTAYYWGDSIGSGNANCAGCGSSWDGMQTSPVGSFQPNSWGLYDMLGDVWQWTQDCYNSSYSGAPTDGTAWTGGDCSDRVLRGGSWFSIPQYLRSAYRNGDVPSDRYNSIGFRLARTLS